MRILILTTIFFSFVNEVVANDYKLNLFRNINSFTVSTDKLSAKFKDGMIVGLRDLKNGRVWANSKINNRQIPCGLGILTDIKTFKSGHIPWGEPTLNQHLKPDFKLNNYFRPTNKSKFSLNQNSDSIEASWMGLSNGEKVLPNAKFIVKIKTDSTGALLLQTESSYSKGKVFGNLMPITNLDYEATYIMPSFGGMLHTKKGALGLMPHYRAPFVEAPIMIVQSKNNSLAFWMENPKQQPFYLFLKRGKNHFGMAFENQTLMPFEDKKRLKSPILKINVFNGDWKTAATPYRNWYRKHFQKEIAIRNKIKWAQGIGTIIDIYKYAPKDEVFQKIAKVFPKETILFQNWNARAAGFDRELPDWTPRDKYISGVKRIHKHGMRAMAYVNTYCANYKSKFWLKDKLSDFFLTRKNSPYQYKGTSISDTDDTLNEKLIGTVDYSSSKNQFTNIKAGRLLYGDPLSEEWCKYHADMMKWWNNFTGTDANYEDTAGCVGDYGNGIVNGLSAGEGSIAQMRILQKIQPDVPMSSEFGPDGIAFACNWALNYAGMWGYESFRKYRTNNQCPLTVFLYGYRQWVPALRGSNDFTRHAMAATSDATGGLGFIMVDAFLNKSIEELNDDFSFDGHFLQRAKLFSHKRLVPFFPKGNYPENIRCMYKGNDGIYSYYDDGKLQEMINPNKKELYGRVFGANEVKTKLWLANWPLQNGKRIWGLNPENHYPLFQQPKKVKLPPITVNGLSPKIILGKYYDTPNFTYMEFNGKADKLALKLKLSEKYKEFYVNGEKKAIGNISGKLPLRLLAVKEKAEYGFGNQAMTKTISAGRMINKGSSLLTKPQNISKGQKLYYLKGKSIYVDYLIKVPNANSSLKVYFQNLAPDSRHGCDASLVRLLINGKEIKSFDARSKNPTGKPKYLFDTKLHSWQIPLAKYAGKTILVTLVSDWKENSNWDKQYIGVPRLVQDSDQKIIFKTYDSTYKVITAIPVSTKWEGGKVEKTPEGCLIRNSGIRVPSGHFQVDPSKIYRLSAKFKADKANPKKWVCLGFMPLNKSQKAISPSSVNIVVGTQAVMSSPVKAGDTKIKINDASKWKKGKHLYLVFDAMDDLKDLPNERIYPIKSINGSEITLAKAVKGNYPAGSKVREHKSGGSYIYSSALYKKIPAEDWIECSGIISGISNFSIPQNQWWKGTKYARIVILTNQENLSFKDLKLEIVE